MIKKIKTLVLGTSIALMSVQAVQAGYVKDNTGTIVRNSSNDCWHTGFWQPDDAVVGCDGVVEQEVAAVVVTPMASEVKSLDRVVLDVKSYFGFDTAALKPGAIDKLDALIESIRESEGVERIVVTGHADRIGTEAYNEELSRRRAEAVAGYLQERIGNEERFEIVGMGESMPVADCTGKRGEALISCLAPDRRVEVDAQIKVFE